MCFCVIIRGIKYILKLFYTGAIGKLLFNTYTREFCYGLREGNATHYQGETVVTSTITDKGLAYNGNLFAIVGIIQL